MRDRVLILSVLIVASCGLGYELISSALASYLLGDSILQFSSVIGCYLFAMGIGSWLSKYVKDEDVLNRFIDVELLVALLGGVSAAVLFLVFAWLSAPFRAALYVGVFVIGLMVGMEIPLVMRVFNQRKAEFREIVSRVLTFDYLGALAVSLVFPLLLAPAGAAAHQFPVRHAERRRGAVDHLAVPRRSAPARRARGARRRGAGPVDAGLRLFRPHDGLGGKGLYGDDVVHAETTPYQRLVVTRWHDDLRLYINGNLQFSSRDEHRYHEALVHPGLLACPGPATYWCWAAATGWRCARFSSTRTSNTSRWWTWTRPDGPVLALRAAGQAEPGRAQDRASPSSTMMPAAGWKAMPRSTTTSWWTSPTRPTSAWAGCTLCPSTT